MHSKIQLLNLFHFDFAHIERNDKIPPIRNDVSAIVVVDKNGEEITLFNVLPYCIFLSLENFIGRIELSIDTNMNLNSYAFKV